MYLQRRVNITQELQHRRSKQRASHHNLALLISPPDPVGCVAKGCASCAAVEMQASSLACSRPKKPCLQGPGRRPHDRKERHGAVHSW